MAADLVSLVTAKEHLRVISSDHDEDIQQKLDDAEDIVVDYLKKPDHGWTEGTVPPRVRAAILLVLGALFENREGGDPISDAVRSVLWRDRDPALA